MYVQIFVNINIYLYIYTYTYMYMYIHTYIYIFIYAHVYAALQHRNYNVLIKSCTIRLVHHLLCSVELLHSETYSISVELHVDGKIKHICRHSRLAVCQRDLGTRHLFRGVRRIVILKGQHSAVGMLTRQ